MYNKYNKIAFITALIIEFVLIFYAVTSFFTNPKILGLSILAIICIIIPFIISYVADKKKLFLPASFNLISVLFLFAALYLGEINNYYIIYWWWDLLLHAVFGSYTVVVFLHIIKGVIRREIEVSKNRFYKFKVLFAFSFAVSLGTLWELFEFSSDFFFKTGMIKGGLEDTSTDLIIKITASIFTSAYYYIIKRES